ncbi:DUF6545 domain-containing protein [Nocardia sp. CA-128927]|uniref:DUF6545 domain-containing protein n=1 Tax=Nocardia sp. CA-128927 TaxID=3239975 RepID=UPI003D9692F2
MVSEPPLLIVAFVVLVGLISVGHWLLVNESVTDRLINHALAWDNGARLAFVCCAGLGHPDLGRRLFLGASVLAVSKYLGFARLLDGANPLPAAQRQRRSDGRAASFGVVVGLFTIADECGLPLSRAIDWETILWGAVLPFVIWTGFLLARASLGELRGGVRAARERLTYSALLVLGCYIIVSSTYNFITNSIGSTPGNSATVMAVASDVAGSLFVVLIAVPLLEALLVRARLDLEGSQCRRLHPLWHDLTAVVPEVVLPADHPRDSSSRLYRMTVEIRDALVHLKQFMPDDSAIRPDNISRYALRIAAAAHLRRHGVPTHPPSATIHLPADNRAGELHNLLALSREWPRARATVASETFTALK